MQVKLNGGGARETNRPPVCDMQTGGRPSSNSDSDVVVQLELVRVRTLLDRGDLLRALEVTPSLDQVRGEHATGGQELGVSFQALQRFFERGGNVIDLGVLFRRKFVDVLVDRGNGTRCASPIPPGLPRRC